MRGLCWICLTSGQEAPSCIAIMTSFAKPASSAHSSIVKQPFSGHTSYTDNNDEMRMNAKEKWSAQDQNTSRHPGTLHAVKKSDPSPLCA